MTTARIKAYVDLALNVDLKRFCGKAIDTDRKVIISKKIYTI